MISFSPTSITLQVSLSAQSLVHCHAVPESLRFHPHFAIDPISHPPQLVGVNGSVVLGRLIPNSLYFVECLAQRADNNAVISKYTHSSLVKTSDIDASVGTIIRSRGVIKCFVESNYHTQASCSLLDAHTKRTVGTEVDKSSSTIRMFTFPDRGNQLLLSCSVSLITGENSYTKHLPVVDIPATRYSNTALLTGLGIVFVLLLLCMCVAMKIRQWRNVYDADEYERVSLLARSLAGNESSVGSGGRSNAASHMFSGNDDDDEMMTTTVSTRREVAPSEAICNICGSINPKSATVCRSCNSLVEDRSRH